MRKRTRTHEEYQLSEVADDFPSRSQLTPERLEKMYQAARYYYEWRKIRNNRCPYCHATCPNLKDSLGSHCPHCRKEWASDQKVRLTQDEVAELMRTPIYRPSRSEVQRLLSE